MKGILSPPKLRELINVIRNLRSPETPVEKCDAELEEIAIELLDRTERLVLKEREYIEGLGARLADSLHAYGAAAVLTRANIAAMASMKARFPEL
jgi:hypothetical protein